jgi:simple sugar transport system substrate-binding protein
MSKVHPVVEEAVDTLGLNKVTRRRLLGGVGLTSASLAASALLAACTNNDDKSSDSAAATSAGDFPSTPKWKFVFVCHVTTNPFFTPTQYGAQDACALLNCEFQWTGSKDSIVAEMVNATNTAISAKADGIALAVVDKNAFNARSTRPWRPASRSSPTTPTGQGRPRHQPPAYIGQGLYDSGFQLGQRAIESGLEYGGCRVHRTPGKCLV